MRDVIRQRILEKFNHKCNYCGFTDELEIDHIIPVSKGGRADEDNLQVLCRHCNRKKKDRLPFDKLIKKVTNKEYILINNRFAEVMKYLKPNELQSILNHYFKDE